MQRSRVAGNGSPGNLKDRIAALQQRAASNNPSAGTPAPISIPTSSSSSLVSSPSASSNTGNALRDRIAKFEKKGGVPVPRGSFGLGAPPPQQVPTREGDSARKKGELYGNRIASVQKQVTGNSENSTASSPPTSIRRQYTGGVALGLGRPRNSIDEANADLPQRKRCISTSGLSAGKPGAGVNTVCPVDITDTTAFDEDIRGSGTSFPAVRLFTSDHSNDGAQTLSAPRITRSVSASPAMESTTCTSDESSIIISSPSPVLGDDSTKIVSQENTQSRSNFKDDSEKPQRDDQTGDDHKKLSSAPSQKIRIKNDNIVEVEAKDSPVVKVEAPEDNVAIPEEVEEDPAKTPVVSTFSATSGAPPKGTDVPCKDTTTSPTVKSQDLTTENESICSDPSSISTPSSSPLHASLEISERAYHETQKYVVVPSGSADTTIANVLEQHNATMSIAETSEKKDDHPLSSAQDEGRASTDTINGSNQKASEPKKPLLASPATISIPSRRRDPPSPLSLSPDKQDQYSEPSLDLKIVPKSFHAVVHGKPQVSFPSTTASVQLPRAAPPSQVVIMREGTKEEARVEPTTPGSPELSSLVAQAMFLEQQLGEDIPSPTKSTMPTKQSPSKASPVKPEPLKAAATAVVDELRAPPSRQSSGWSSENASSVDSAPVLTPPSPTFDLGSAFDPRDLGLNLGLESPDDSRRSMSSVLSSPGRSSVRKKVISMSRNSIRRLARRSSSTLALPDDASELAYMNDSSSTKSPRSPSPTRSLAPSLPTLNLPSGPTFKTSPGVRPLSLVTASSTSASTSPLDYEFFDSFPAVPNTAPNAGNDYDRGLGLKLNSYGFEKEDIILEEPSSPLPPTPPSKSPIAKEYDSAVKASTVGSNYASPPPRSHSLPQHDVPPPRYEQQLPPPPPSPRSKKMSPGGGKQNGSSNTTSSIFSTISRSFSSRSRG